MKYTMNCFAKWMSVVLLAVVAVSCSNDDSGDSVAFELPSVYFSAAGQQAVVSYTTNDVYRVYISARPKGWTEENVSIDVERRQVTIVVPAATEDGSIASSGTVTISGYSSADNIKSASLFVGVVPTRQLQGPANSFIATEKELNYAFDLVRADGSKVPAARVGLLWQSTSRLIQYLYLDKQTNRASFYIGADMVYTDEIVRGNALIGAYDADDNLLWSWHIWSCDYDPAQHMVEWQNGYRMMDRNLGALDSANSTAAERQASYGLYYQWGRKDPFAGPIDYKFSNGSSQALYISDYALAEMDYVEADAETGTEEYAVAHPMTFITGVESNGYNWMWNAAATEWSPANDPCPLGWRVAPAGAFAGLMLEGEPTADDADVYGWPMTDGVSRSLFMAGGRRTFLTGYFQNVYDPIVDSRAGSAEEAQPWVGFYWTRESAANQTGADSFYFWFNKKQTTAGVSPLLDSYRSNGFSVRCVRE